MTQIQTTSQYPEPPAELIEDIRQRLAQIPPDVLERANHALKHEPIERAGSLLWKAGACFTSAELYEYRKTLFPPNAMLDPYTAGPPVVCKPAHGSADSLSALPPGTDNGTSAGALAKAAPLTPDSPPHPIIHPSIQKSNNPSGGAALLDDLRDVINRYVVLPHMAAETLALWIVHTYAFTLRQVTTYIGVVSPEKRCGKTTLLELLSFLAHEAIAAANISPSALFRVIEEARPTLIIDEADTFLQGRDEMAGILNAGYRKGNSYVVRVAEGKARRNPEPRILNSEPQTANREPSGLVRYSCWCPKVMAAIGRLPDTLADRCIIITMQRKMPGEKCERMRQLNAADYNRRCADFVREHSEAIAQARPETPSTLNDRAADIWEPLLAIADLAGGDWPQLARDAARQLSASDDDITLLGYFLKDLRALMLNSKVDRVLSRDIIRVLNPMHDRPWEDLRRGREINEWWLGWQMRQLGIRPKYLRTGESVARGYTLEDVESAFRRYLPNAELHTAPDQDTSRQPAAAPAASEDKTYAQIDKLIEQLLQGDK